MPQVHRQPPPGDNNQPAPLGDFLISSADERSLTDYPNGTWAAVEQVVAGTRTLSQRSLKELKNDHAKANCSGWPSFSAFKIQCYAMDACGESLTPILSTPTGRV